MSRGMRAMRACALVTGLALLGCLPTDNGEAKRGGAAALLAAVTGDGSEPATASEGGEKVVYYKYVDESGSVRFVERLADVPPSQREGARIEWKAEPRTQKSAKPRTSRWQDVSRSLASRLGADETSTSARRGQPEVVVYTTTWCGWCRKTLAHLDANGVRYDNRDIERDREAYSTLKRKTGSTGVPVIEIGDQLVIGFDRRRIDQLLGL